MPVAIKIKRFETVGDVPNTSELVDGEIAVNVADKKIYVRDGSSIVTISGADFSAVAEDIIPDGNGTRNLGSATKRFADLFLSGDTINLGGATISSEPLIISPDDGQGAKKLKSYKLAGGDIDINDSISGRLISNCIAIQAPKENPATQQPVESLFNSCIQSRADAASESSPMPASYSR